VKANLVRIGANAGHAAQTKTPARETRTGVVAMQPTSLEFLFAWPLAENRKPTFRGPRGAR
jgi:hypothetical protein